MSQPLGLIPEVESPCIGTCTLGPGGYCVGCFRSAEEIGAWLSDSPAQRRAIMDGLADRAQKLFDDD